MGGGGCPTTLYGRGNDTLRHWMGEEWHPAIREAQERALRPRGLLWGMSKGMESPWVAGLGAYSPKDSRNRGRTAPEIAGPTDTQSL